MGSSPIVPRCSENLSRPKNRSPLHSHCQALSSALSFLLHRQRPASIVASLLHFPNLSTTLEHSQGHSICLFSALSLVWSEARWYLNWDFSPCVSWTCLCSPAISCHHVSSTRETYLYLMHCLPLTWVLHCRYTNLFAIEGDPINDVCY